MKSFDLQSYRTRLVGTLTALFALPLLLGTYLVWNQRSGALLEEQRRDGEAIAKTIASAVSPEHFEALVAGDESVDRQRLNRPLVATGKQLDLEGPILVMTVKPSMRSKVEDKPDRVFPDAMTVPLSSMEAFQGTTADYTPEMARALFAGVPTNWVDQGSTLVTATPLFDAFGKPIGLVRLDQEQGRGSFQALFEAIMATFLVLGTLFLVSKVLGLVCGQLLRSITQIEAAARRMASGDFDTRIDIAGSSKEIAATARSLERLRSQVKDREQSSCENNERLLEETSRVERDKTLTSGMLANLSGDLRKPVLDLVRSVHRLEREAGNPHEAEIAHEAMNQGCSLLSEVDRIFHVARIEAGVRPDTVDFDVAALVRQSVEVHQTAAKDKGLNLRLFLPDGLPSKVRGDANSLSGILLRLINNAVKSTVRGDVTVRVLPVAADPELSVLRFEVADTGCGMGVNEQQAVQARMRSQAMGAREQTCGIAIASKLVRNVDGELAFESRPQCGTRFWFSARFGRVQAPQAEFAGVA